MHDTSPNHQEGKTLPEPCIQLSRIRKPRKAVQRSSGRTAARKARVYREHSVVEANRKRKIIIPNLCEEHRI